MTAMPLAAIQFTSEDVDALLAGIADTLTRQGLRVSGALQSRGTMGGECHCADMDLTTIGSNRVFRISQPLGNGSHGCRLHPGALAECSAFLAKELTEGCDLLILNRFGRGESEGRGFRDLISCAVSLDVPVLTAVRTNYIDPWRQFGGGMTCDLAPDAAAVLGWFQSVQKPKAAA